MPHLIAIYDLDRTLLSRATFTPFLLFAARRRAPWRLAFAPLWVAAMLGYKAGLCSRGALKQLGLRLFLARADAAALADLAGAFADRVVPAWIAPGAARALARDRGEGRRLVLATAAMEFYAGEIARRIGFDHVVATRHELPGDRPWHIAGDNCWGEAKVPRVKALFGELGLDRAACHVRFYTDSTSDAPLLDWADEGVLVDTGPKGRALAGQRGWTLARFA